MVNPLWLIAELAELGAGRRLKRLYDDTSLSAYNTVTKICHGDLHGENILCAAPNQSGTPRPIIVDFETTHEGHICRDFGRSGRAEC
jgi:Ser/Thr protein kinase RdoA (MazF antagonist)